MAGYIDKQTDIWKITMAFVFKNEQVQEPSVQCVVLSNGTTDSRPTIAGVVDSLIHDHIVAYLSKDTYYYGCRISSARGSMPWASYVTRTQAQGLDIGATLPTQCRIHTTWKTDYVGVKYRGRTYWPTPGASSLDPTGEPSLSWVAACNVVADLMRVGLMGQGGTVYQPCIHHKVPYGDPPNVYHAITQQRTNNRWSTQRRGGDYGRTQGIPW